MAGIREAQTARRAQRLAVIAALAAVVLAAAACGGAGPSEEASTEPPHGVAAADLSLPAPRLEGSLSVEEALARRRSVREFGDAALTAAQLSQLLWAAQGITAQAEGLRTAPSAGALYPLELYVAVDDVADIPAVVYRYTPTQHRLGTVLTGSVRPKLWRAALSQSAVADAPATIAVAAVFARTTRKYGERGRRYVYMEAGHAAQNVYLQAEALGLGTVVIGAFDDGVVHDVLAMGSDEEPLYLMPVGPLP